MIPSVTGCQSTRVGRIAPPFSSVCRWAPGTCGELLQGWMESGPFLVSCPIDLGTAIQAEALPARAQARLTDAGSELNPRFRKLALAAERTRHRLPSLRSSSVRFQRWSDLDVGKGMGSSTADIVAGIRALAALAGIRVSAHDVAAVAASVEPSDTTVYPGLCAIHRQTGELLHAFPWWPEFHIVMLVPPERLPTARAGFDARAGLTTRDAALFEQLKQAARDRDPISFARVATESGDMNQRFVPNRLFQEIRPRLAAYGALGMAAAHTGTVAGLLFSEDATGWTAATDAARRLAAEYGTQVKVRMARLAPTGCAEEGDQGAPDLAPLSSPRGDEAACTVPGPGD